MRFATRMLLAQLVVIVLVVLLCAAVFGAIAIQQVRASAEESALSIARAVAASAEVRRDVAAESADPALPDAAVLRTGALQAQATEVAERTGSLFVVVTDDHGYRLAHPDPDRIGEVVSTSFAAALRGEEVVTWETGTLGDSARAKVPVLAPGTTVPVGEVSVGFSPASVFDDVPGLVSALAGTVALALALGILASLLLRRRLEQVTLGLQPEELVTLAQTQAAVLDASAEGVLAVDRDGVVRVCSETAERLLGIRVRVGAPIAGVDLPEELVRALAGDTDTVSIAAGDRILYVDVRPIGHGSHTVGRVAIVRDRTELIALSERLDSVRTMSEALRAQRHEFANRLHTAAGLLDADRVPEAREFIAELHSRGAVDYDVPGFELVRDRVLQSFLGAKAVAARERGVTLSIADQTLLRGTLREVENTLAVIGNLLDNAITAAAAADAPRRVELTLLDDGAQLVVTVADTGSGVADPVRAFDRAASRENTPEQRGDSVHGHGFGLPLARELARRAGGDVWIVDAGGDGGGAVFAARLDTAMREADAAGEVREG